VNIAFIHAPEPIHALEQNYGMKFMPVWAYTLASYIDEVHQLSLFDTQFDKLENIKGFKLILYSGLNQDINQILKSLRKLKLSNPNGKHIIGGPICWSLKQAGELELLGEFDHICVGDGELLITEIVEAVEKGLDLPKHLEAQQRFSVASAKPMHKKLLVNSINRYYGAVVEVSRGCPFLCEFCDIRIMKDNNRTHSLSPKLIVEEIDFLVDQGVKQITLACDNFIGDLAFANAVVDEILLWQQKTKKKISIYTWLTINVYQYKALLTKMRKAGFDMLFIGIESFDHNSLLETAKVQNDRYSLDESLKVIHSYGFIVIAGLIFGFDSDGPDFVNKTLEGIETSGLISGDPNWLTALPGTPLYYRMRLGGRLRQTWATHGAFKFQTNIKYLMPKDFLISEFRRFITIYTSGAYQYKRFENYIKSFQSINYIASSSSGFGDLPKFLKAIVFNPKAIKQFSMRFYHLFKRPTRLLYALKGLVLIAKYGKMKSYWPYFQFWIFTWSNSMVKYLKLKDSDFDIESVGVDFKLSDILPNGYMESNDEDIPANKTKAQRSITERQLIRTIQKYRHE